MNIGSVVEFTKASFGRSVQVTKRYAPEIMTAVGAVGVVVTAVAASRATLKLEPVIDNIQRELEEARLNNYSNPEKLKVLVQAGVDIGKLYGPTITYGVISISCIIGSHNLMSRRNLAIAAAYTALEGAFNEYRSRVIEEFGEDKDLEYRRGLRQEQITDEKTGKVKTVTTMDPTKVSAYARFFDQTSSAWEREPEYNMAFLRAQQQYANDRLLARGYLFLNEVYESLGLEHSRAGAVVGWILEKDGDGDNYVDFGIYNFPTEAKRAFVNGQEHSILLDFNVQGLIYDRIP